MQFLILKAVGWNAQEPGEEVRLLIVQLLKKLLNDYREVFRSAMGSASDVLAKVLLDKYPEVKREAAELVQQFCNSLPEHIGLNAKQIVKSLALNAKHQHSKVRKVTVEVLADSITLGSY